MNTLAGIWMNTMQCDNVNIIVFGAPDISPPPTWWPHPPLTKFTPTEGNAMDHIAFSYRDVTPVLERMRAAGVKIVRQLSEREGFGMQSFFVRGPGFRRFPGAMAGNPLAPR